MAKRAYIDVVSDYGVDTVSADGVGEENAKYAWEQVKAEKIGLLDIAE